MKKSAKSKGPKIDPYLEGLMAKLLDRLVHLEKKIDTVVAQTSARSSDNGHHPKPFQVPTPVQQPRRDRTMYEAICADCSKVCEVPFRPSEDRAVYCKTCFAKRKSGGHGPGMPILRPVSLPPKPASKLSAAAQAASLAAKSPKKTKKSKPAKKTKKKK